MTSYVKNAIILCKVFGWGEILWHLRRGEARRRAGQIHVREHQKTQGEERVQGEKREKMWMLQ